jgi:hypothetical protein
MGPFPAPAEGHGASLTQDRRLATTAWPSPQPTSPGGGIKGRPNRPLLLSPAHATLSFHLTAVLALPCRVKAPATRLDLAPLFLFLVLSHADVG